MSTANHLCGLVIGQPCEPSADLMVAIAEASNDATLIALADQVAETMVDLIRLVGAQSFLQLTIAQCIKSGELPAAVLERSLFNARSELANAKAEAERSERRLAEHRLSFQ